jgi:hypothetical protein
LTLAQVQTAASAEPPPAADPLVNAGPRLREWAFLDDVDVYQKAGLIEIYGGVLTQRRTGPIAVRSAILTTTTPKTWLVWSPDYSPLIDAQRIELDLDADTVQAGKLTVGVILADNSFVGWTARLGPDMPADPSLKPVAVPNDIAEPVGRAAVSIEALRAVGDGRYVGEVPATLKAALGGAAPARRAVKAWVLTLEGGAPGAIAVRRLALSGPKQNAAAPMTSALAGQVQGVPIMPGDRIELVLENNEVRSNELALDGSFGFYVPTRLAASLRYRFKDRQGPGFLRAELPGILATRTDVLSPGMLRVIEALAGDWRHLDARIEVFAKQIKPLQHPHHLR